MRSGRYWAVCAEAGGHGAMVSPGGCRARRVAWAVGTTATAAVGGGGGDGLHPVTSTAVRINRRVVRISPLATDAHDVGLRRSRGASCDVAVGGFAAGARPGSSGGGSHASSTINIPEPRGWATRVEARAAAAGKERRVCLPIHAQRQRSDIVRAHDLVRESCPELGFQRNSTPLDSGRTIHTAVLTAWAL
jgi:hypothetical protein